MPRKAQTGETTKLNPTFEDRVAARLDEYGRHFNIAELNDANDKSLLNIMIKTELMIDDLQEQIQALMSEDAVSNAGNIKKLADLLRDATGTITNLQRTLSIDRKSRKTDDATSFAEYVRQLKANASEFVERRLIKIYCPNCKVLVGRFSPVHKHTAFTVSVQCSQCGKAARARRDERDIFFDVRDSEWRRKHRAEIIQPKMGNTISEELSDETQTSSDDNVIIFADLGAEIAQEAGFTAPPEVSEGLEIGDDDASTA